MPGRPSTSTTRSAIIRPTARTAVCGGVDNKPVYVLTSSRMISAGEQFAYDLKMLERATLVGETTAGGGHAANLQAIGDNFYVATVEVRAINPYSKHD